MINQGPNPPPVLRLSDGGHIENLGILPLLKLRLKRIVSVNGGRTISDGDYGSTLLAGLDMARKKLGCSFSAMDGRDIAEDIRDNFVEKPPGSQPSSYRLGRNREFYVRYIIVGCILMSHVLSQIHKTSVGTERRVGIKNLFLSFYFLFMRERPCNRVVCVDANNNSFPNKLFVCPPPPVSLYRPLSLS